MSYRRFAFDTEFDGAGVVVPPPPTAPSYDAQDLEAARAEGFAAGERSAVARAQIDATAALAALAAAAEHGLSALAEVAHSHKAGSVTLAMAAAGRIAEAALARFPEAAAAAALEALAREVEASPRLLLRVRPEHETQLREAVERAATAAGYPGQLMVKADPSLAPSAFIYDWGDGRAAFDPAAAAGRIADALFAVLAAEGLHGEPLPTPDTIQLHEAF